MNGIEQVLKEVTEQRELLESRLSNLKAAEENLVAFLQRGRQLALPLAPPFAQRRLNPYKVVVTKKKEPKRTKATRKSKGGGAGSEELLVLGRQVGEPFGSQELQDLGLDWRRSSNAITRWAMKGWITRVSPGQYKRTRTFPAAPADQVVAGPSPRPAPAAVRIPGLDQDRGTIEEQLQKALKERDAAVASGHQNLARILQDKVNKLQDQLGET